jgi:hypothetical protein
MSSKHTKLVFWNFVKKLIKKFYKKIPQVNSIEWLFDFRKEIKKELKYLTA